MRTSLHPSHGATLLSVLIMLVIEKFAAPDALPGEFLVLTYEYRCKNRLRTRLDSGEEVGLFLERGTILRHGHLLEANDGRIVQVKAAIENVMDVETDDALKLMRAAYHLGNRHVSLQIREGSIRFPSDHVLGEMIRGLGLEVCNTLAPFEPESGAYGGYGGHAHGHSADGEGKGARIHDMSRYSR